MPNEKNFCGTVFASKLVISPYSISTYIKFLGINQY